MERIPVSSSSVVSIGYDAEIQVLEIEFQGSGTYQYQGVPQEVFDQLMSAPSKGVFVNKQIKPFYVVVRVE
jgi:hypothetical protein